MTVMFLACILLPAIFTMAFRPFTAIKDYQFCAVAKRGALRSKLAGPVNQQQRSKRVHLDCSRGNLQMPLFAAAPKSNVGARPQRSL